MTLSGLITKLQEIQDLFDRTDFDRDPVVVHEGSEWELDVQEVKLVFTDKDGNGELDYATETINTPKIILTDYEH